MMTDAGGDLRMEGGVEDERDDDSPLHAANTTPTASDLAAAAAALAAAVGNTVDLTEAVVPNPYQLAAMSAPPGTPRNSVPTRSQSSREAKGLTKREAKQRVRRSVPNSLHNSLSPHQGPRRSPQDFESPQSLEATVCLLRKGSRLKERGEHSSTIWMQDLRRGFMICGRCFRVGNIRCCQNFAHIHKASIRSPNKFPILIRDNRKWQASKSVFKTALMKWRKR